MSGRASVIGAGPNGLSAAIVLAQAGFAGGCIRSRAAAWRRGANAGADYSGLPPRFRFGGSSAGGRLTFFLTLPLASYGLEWIHSPSTFAHPFDDGTAITLERDLSANEAALGKDAQSLAPIDGAAGEKLAGSLGGSTASGPHFFTPPVVAGAVRPERSAFRKCV